VLVAPLRHPVLLAKEAASLQLLSGGRLILGLGAGWNPVEFGALGVPRSERGSRTDEILDALRVLLGRPEASFAGDHFRFDDVVLEPRPDPPIPLWIGGGTQPPMRGASERHLRAPDRVIRRIAGADGWCAPPHAGPEQLAGDWERIQGAARSMGRDPRRITFAQQGYVHLVETASRDRALEEQRRAFEGYLGPARPWSFARANYLVGTFDDVIERLRQRAATGVEELVLGPVTADPREIRRQLELLRTRVVPELG
jgi:alkanesulfonate monooxygenase SsuD/methylene tetrahydromethanopterin reductase-like flavin-dependent oxidoreductase (luciferase family)